MGFISSKVNSSLFIFQQQQQLIMLLVYVDDIIITGSSLTFIATILQALQAEFPIKDVGDLNFFLGVEVHCTSHGISINQQKY